MKITNFFILLVSFMVITTSCSEEDELPTPFDHKAQAIKDDAILKTFLETHYYTPPTITEHFGLVDTITDGGQTPLINQVVSQEVEYRNIDYKLYYLKAMPEGINDKPSKVDSALVNYKGLLLTKVNNDIDERTIFDKNKSFSFWADLYGRVIPGWTHALPNFKSGHNLYVPGNETVDFDQTGKGIIFLPSGLAYRNTGSIDIPANAPIMFHVEVADVKHNDQDTDGVKSIFEDLNNDGDATNDDTDNDGIANFLDSDDDGDGILTKDENADPNNDGDPSDALDSDGDNTPDYLDKD